MVKTKQSQHVAIPTNKNNMHGGHIDLSKSNNDMDLQGEDSWVIVKKQRITILVPSLPPAKKLTTSMGPNQPQTATQKSVSNQIQPSVDDVCPRMPSVQEREKPVSLAPKQGIQFAGKAHAEDIATLAKPPRLDLRAEVRKPDQIGVSNNFKRFGVSYASKVIRRPRRLCCPSVVLDGGMLLNQRLRASNLERNLQKAGGLSRWLASLGLSQFVRIFQRKSVSKFQLVNLTMKKLKDMGANPVGPRRKLIHAIDCVCQPYGLEAI